jgi:predicted dienelactone hydrolase
VEGHARGLIVISHGNGGSLEGHYDTAMALARTGFVVAAMTHTGDNYRDQSRATKLADRPRAVHAVIDYMLSAWPQHVAIDPAKIGVFCFSLGGFTALVSVGGVPDLTTIEPYCASHASTYVCGVLKAHPIDHDHPIHAEDWIADRRIKAAVVAAPTIGFTFSPSGFARCTFPFNYGGRGTIISCRRRIMPRRCSRRCPASRNITWFRGRSFRLPGTVQ